MVPRMYSTYAPVLGSHRFHSIDVILANLDIAKTPTNLDLLPRLLAPSGIAIFLVPCESLRTGIPYDHLCNS